MSDEEVFSSRLTRKETRLIKFFRVLSEEQRTEFTAEIEKMNIENSMQTFDAEREACRLSTENFND